MDIRGFTVKVFQVFCMFEIIINKKASYWLGEDICNDTSDKELIYKIYLKTHTTKHQKNKQPN